MEAGCIPWSFAKQNSERPKKRQALFWPAQGIEAVSFFAAGKKDTSG
jgi:hypothetical protein